MPKRKFEIGHKKVGGKVKGTPNHLTTQMRTVKETVLSAFQELQSDPVHNIVNFAKVYPKDFYNIAAKLIPTEIIGEIIINKQTMKLPDGTIIEF